MPRNAYTLDGVPLVDPAGRFFPEKKTGIRVVPAKLSPNISYPSFDGDAFLPGGAYVPGSIGINMYIRGNTHEEFMQNFEFVNGLFLQRSRVLTLRHDYNEAGTNPRFADVSFSSGATPELFTNGARAAIVPYIGDLPGVFWRNAAPVDSVTSAITTTETQIELLALAGGNAPVHDSLIRVKGAFSSLTLKCAVTGHTISINTSLAATEYIIIDTAWWTARKVTTDTWTGGTNVDSLVTSSRGQGTMISFEPMISGGALKYFIKASATGPSGSPNITVRGYKHYL